MERVNKMEADLANIQGKMHDFKVCTECNSVNHYEKTECHNCGKSDFKEVTQSWVDSEYAFWKDVEGYTESEADVVLYDI
jgi:hypothetical protein